MPETDHNTVENAVRYTLIEKGMLVLAAAAALAAVVTFLYPQLTHDSLQAPWAFAFAGVAIYITVLQQSRYRCTVISYERALAVSEEASRQARQALAEYKAQVKARASGQESRMEPTPRDGDADHPA